MEDADKPVDRRVRKTKQAIRNAFARLLSEKDLNDITVRDIAEAADINRNTFYKYYSGIYQVVDEIENDIARDIDLVVGELNFQKALENPYVIFEKMTSIISMDMDFYGYLLSMRGNLNLVTKVVALLKEKVKGSLMQTQLVDSHTADIVLDYSLAGMIAVYQSWFLSDRRSSIEDISRTISLLSFHGFNGLYAQQNGKDF